MIPPEDKGAKVYGVTLALMFLAMMVIGTGIIGLWKMICLPIIGAFAELGRDLKTIMKGEG